MKAVLIFSGGMDSAVLLYDLINSHGVRNVAALSFDYGQRHRKELHAARAIAGRAGVEHHVADLSAIRNLLAGSSQTSDQVPVPEGHYAEESMKATVVPNRNMIMLAVAAGWAISKRFTKVAYAAHGGDRAIYPDCRRDFTAPFEAALLNADWRKVGLHAPYLDLSKADIAAKGAGLGVPFELTWSCYKGGSKHCGKCGTCVERREAFVVAGVPDPTEYE